MNYTPSVSSTEGEGIMEMVLISRAMMFVKYFTFFMLCAPVCVGVWVYIYHGKHVEFRRQVVGIGSSFLLCGPPQSNSGCQVI